MPTQTAKPANQRDQALKDSFPASDPPANNMGSEAAAEERRQERIAEQTVGDTALKSTGTADLTGKRIAILATDGFEQSELVQPKHALEEAGATTQVVSLKQGSIRGWSGKDWGDEVPVDLALDGAKVEDFDALVLPGGVMNPDHLRKEEAAVAFVRAFSEAKKPVAAICHGPWLLVEAGLAEGHKLTSWPSLKTDISNAGGDWVDEEVVVDGGLITSRKPDDLPAFSRAVIAALGGAGEQRIKIGPTNV